MRSWFFNNQKRYVNIFLSFLDIKLGRLLRAVTVCYQRVGGWKRGWTLENIWISDAREFIVPQKQMVSSFVIWNLGKVFGKGLWLVRRKFVRGKSKKISKKTFGND